MDSEKLGREVRRVWIEFCREIGDDKPSHLASWEDMTEPEREVDRRIGEAVARMALADECERLQEHEKRARALRITILELERDCRYAVDFIQRKDYEHAVGMCELAIASIRDAMAIDDERQGQ